MGNDEFKKAKESTEVALNEMSLKSVEVFMEELLPSFYLSLDEQE